MKLAIASLASGSSGNCYVVKSNTTTLLVDAGISCKQITERLSALGVACLPDAILLTHEHSDHIKGLPGLCKKGIALYGSSGTIGAIPFEGEPCISCFERGDKLTIGDISISSIVTSHDASEPCGYSFESGGSCISVITDTGFVTEDCYRYMQKSDILVLESNHDESMLRIGRYPWFLKQRILSDKGHLSNEAAATALANVLKNDLLCRGETKHRMVLLAHLSKENNFPQMALATLSNVLEGEGFYVGKDISAEALSRTECGSWFVI